MQVAGEGWSLPFLPTVTDIARPRGTLPILRTDVVGNAGTKSDILTAYLDINLGSRTTRTERESG